MKTRLTIFSDFDATITYIDLGDDLFIRYGNIEPLRTQLINKEIDAKKYWRELCYTLSEDVNIEFVNNFALEYQIDPYFKKFSEFCNSNQLPLSIISDGFIEYIKPIMDRENINNINIYCNKFIEKSDGLEPFYPMASESCECYCASCKRNSLIANAEDDQIIVFIGDGTSDFCAAEHSDVIFAKKELAAYCNKNRIPHYTYKSFFDVQNIISKGIENKSFRKRRQAELKRKKAFEIE